MRKRLCLILVYMDLRRGKAAVRVSTAAVIDGIVIGAGVVQLETAAHTDGGLGAQWRGG